MMNPTESFLDTLQHSAHCCAAAEEDFRSQIARRIKELEEQRSFAFRRWTLMKEIAGVITGADSEEIAVAGATAVLRAKLGWVSDSEARMAVVSRFAPVAQAMFVNLASPESDEEDTEGKERPDVVKALAEFESWYATTHPRPFWVLFENYMPETPVVDF